MKDTKEIVLFFEETAKYTPIDVAKELLERYPELGNPLVLPENGNKKNIVMVFNTNMEFQLQSSFYSVNFIINQKYFDKIAGIIFDIVDTFEQYSCKFTRIGYISNIFLPPKSVERAKNRFLKMEHLEGVEEYNLSWYKKIETKKGVINCWERMITDSNNFEDLLCQYDINSPHNEVKEFDMKYIKEFISAADEYIKDRIDF